MTTIVKRLTKGSPLTFAEMDTNFENLNKDKMEKFETNAIITELSGPYVFSPGSPATDRHEFEPDDGGYAAGPHTVRVQFDLTTSGYFALAQGTGAHIALVTHQDPALVATNVRGNGIILGQIGNGIGEQTPYSYNAVAIETWMGGTAATSGNRVFPGSETPPAYTLEDGYDYRFIVSSTVDDLDNKWIRYQAYVLNDAIHPEGAWDLMWDSGYFLDFNEWADFTKTMIAFGQVFEPVGSWSITISNVKIAWGPPESISTGQRHVRFGTNKNLGMFPTYQASPTATDDYTFNMTGWDSTQLKTFSTAAWDWKTVLDVGDIKAFMLTLGMNDTDASAVEWITRPIYCQMALLLWHLRNKGM